MAVTSLEPPLAAQPTAVPTLPTREPGCPTGPIRLVLVDDPAIGRTVAVRWRIQLGHRPLTWIWRCSECGRFSTPDCHHAVSAAITLSESLLGLLVD